MLRLPQHFHPGLALRKHGFAMKLSTRLSIAMVALVIFTVAADAVLTHRELENPIIVASIIAIGAAIAVSLWLSRSLSRSLVQISDAVEAIGRGEDAKVPTAAAGEIGLVA